MSKAKITWLGHASVQVEGNGKIVFFDPWIRENPACPIKMDQIKKADAVCVTHGHNDHIGDSIEIVKKRGAPLICSPEIGFYAERHGIKYDEGSIPLNIGGSLETDAFRITMVNAVHTSDILGIEHLLRQSGIKRIKLLNEFDWTFNPKIPRDKIMEFLQTQWLKKPSNLVIIGPAGVAKPTLPPPCAMKRSSKAAKRSFSPSLT